jgi:acyl-CoA synthetase (AMP-forming)/AMP-acid ligase II
MLLRALRRQVERSPERVSVRHVSLRGGESTRTYAEVWAAAERAAGALGALGVRPGDVVVLIGTHHPDLYGAWLGAVWCGAIPTILAEPSVRIDRAEYAARLGRLLSAVGASLVLLSPELMQGWQPPGDQRTASYSELVQGPRAAGEPHAAESGDPLLLQHSSGTTGLQKGVVLTHRAVMTHAEAYGKVLELGEQDVVASWLPLYHDMGLIACFVTPLLFGVPVVWFSPFEWVAEPLSLLHAVGTHRVSLIWLPNFAFCLLADRAAKGGAALSLGSLRAVVNCSEPVTAEAMDYFCERFAPHGLSKAALHTCYAMAENVFGIAASNSAAPPRRLYVDPAAWQTTQTAIDAADTDRALSLVSSGTCLPGASVRVTLDDGTEAPPRRAGRLLIRSPFLFEGYFRRPDLNRGLLVDGYFDTGDVGFLDEHGHVYVTGRKKDLIICGGRNLHPQDIEAAAASVDAVYPGRAVAFGVPLRIGTEGVVVLVESEADAARWPEIAANVRRRVPARLDVDLVDAKVVARTVLKKSTSGKLARGANRRAYLEGSFGRVAPEVVTAPPPARGGV